MITGQLFLAQLFNGLILGAIYTLLAIGLSIIFGMMNFVNFAHGICYVMGAYTVYAILSSTGNFWLGLLAAPVIAGLIGIILEAFLLKRLYKLQVVYTILATFGIALVIREAIILIWDPTGKPVFAPPFLRGFLDLGIVLFPKYRVFLFIVAIMIMTAIWFVIEKTKYGSIIRAGTEDADMVSCLGINISRVFTLTFGLGVAIAALSGGLMASVRGVEPFMGDMMMGISFAVVIIGGLGSFTGAILAGFIVGMAQSLVVLIAPGMSIAIIFIIMTIILLIKPQGLFGVQR